MPEQTTTEQPQKFVPNVVTVDELMKIKKDYWQSEKSSLKPEEIAEQPQSQIKQEILQPEKPSLRPEEIIENEKRGFTKDEYEDIPKPLLTDSIIRQKEIHERFEEFKKEVDQNAKKAWEKLQKEVESSMKRSEENVLENISNPYKDERSVNFLGKKDKQLTEEKPDFTPNFPEYSNLWMESIQKMNELNKSGVQNPDEKQRLSQEIADYGIKAIKSIAYSFENGTAYSASLELAQENIAANRVSPNNTYRRNSILCDAVTLYTEKLQKSSKIIFDSIGKYGQTTYPIDFYNHLENKFEDLKQRISFIKIETIKLERSGINQQDAIINSFKNTFGEQSVNFVEEEKVVQNPIEQEQTVSENESPTQSNPQLELVKQEEKTKTPKLIKAIQRFLGPKKQEPKAA